MKRTLTLLLLLAITFTACQTAKQTVVYQKIPVYINGDTFYRINRCILYTTKDTSYLLKKLPIKRH